MLYKKLTKCIACANTNLSLVFDLGNQPLANNLQEDADIKQDKFPLAINICNNCYHVQLTHIINPDLLFKHYPYLSGVSKTSLDFFNWFAKFAVDKSTNPKTILDIGCNDGSQLNYFKQLGLKTFGVDPAANIVAESSKHHFIKNEFFNESSFNCKFDIILIQNAFAHNNDQLKLLCDAKHLMKNSSKLFIVTSQKDMIRNGEFDTIYHEHISFYNIRSMNEICKRAGLNLIDVHYHSIHGNSYIFEISKVKQNFNYIDKLILEEEKNFNLQNIIQEFNSKVTNIVKSYEKVFHKLKEDNIPIIGYSAPAKGMTFLNYTSLKPDFIIDDTPLKQNLFTPGLGIKIVSAKELDKYKDIEQVCFIVLAWNFYKEITEKIKKLRPNRKDKFIKCFPEFYME
jgi:SAM-dependent methyltransferase